MILEEHSAEERDRHFMALALQEAGNALEIDEVPIGTVIVYEQKKVIGRGFNMVERLCDPTAHAEMQAITAATSFLNSKFLHGCTVYSSLEPCPMCAGALYLARPDRLVFAAKDPKRGYSEISPSLVHPKTIVSHGILAEESSNLLRSFFKEKRHLD